MDYRKKKSFSVVTIPTGIVEEDRGLIECCCSYDVVASLTSNDTWKNDVKGVYLKRSSLSDSVTFVIKKNDVILANLGTVATFPNEPLGIGFIYDWKRYLTAHGVGCYEISKSFTISGVTGGFVEGIFNLSEYSTERLDNTCRIRSEFSSYNVKMDFDFTGSNLIDDLRFEGYFGLRQPNTEVSNLVNTGRKVVKTTREHLNTYQLIAEPITNCKSGLLLDMHLLNEDTCYLSDFNKANHSQYLDFSVILNGNVSVEYPGNARIMKLSAQFGDKVVNQKSMYNVI